MSGNEDGQDSGTEQPRPETPDVAPQLAVVEFRRVFSSLPFFGSGGDGNLGKTSFEAHRLNQMIDLVENARPSDLERAGDALWKAGGAIRRAAEELSGHIERVDWEGESGDSFRRWGKKLVTNSRKLAEYSETAGTQIKASGAGLATVQKAMPPRDSRLVQKDVDDIPAPARVKGNQEYDEAAKVEEDRQEAINQMNRLGSYYTVSHEVMAGLEPPTFGPMPDPGVPQPPSVNAFYGDSGGQSPSDGYATRQSGVASSSPSASGDVPEGRPGVPVRQQPSAVPGVPDTAVGTEIDSVAGPTALADPVTYTATPSAPSASGPAGPTAPVGAPGPLAFGAARSGAGRTPGISGTPRAAGQAPAGRAGATGQTAPFGRAAGAGTGPGPLGRAANATPGSIAGRPASLMSPRVAGPSGGIVGGTPSRSSAGAGVARIPRGTVIGGKSLPMGSAATVSGGRVGPGPGLGVTGDGTPAGRRAASEPGGVIGTPRPGGSAQGRGPREFTPGGSGLVRAVAGESKAGGVPARACAPSARERGREESSRPDWLTEDGGTWTTDRRDVVPPVIE